MAKMVDTSVHKRLMEARLKDPEFRSEYEQSRREIELIDRVIHQLDELREEKGLSKADLARLVDRNPSSIRRLFTQQSNPELALIAALTVALGGELKIVVPSKKQPTKSRERALATA